MQKPSAKVMQKPRPLNEWRDRLGDLAVMLMLKDGRLVRKMADDEHVDGIKEYIFVHRDPDALKVKPPRKRPRPEIDGSGSD